MLPTPDNRPAERIQAEIEHLQGLEGPVIAYAIRLYLQNEPDLRNAHDQHC